MRRAATPHSDYFIVTFAPATLEPSPEGKIALDKAIGDAGGSALVMIEGAVNNSPANSEHGALVQQRAAELEEAFAKAGVTAPHVRLRLREVGDAEFANRKESLIVQVAFGTDAEN